MNLKAILIAAMLVIGGAAIAQGGAKTGQSGNRQGPGGGQMRMRTPEERVDRMAKQLNLTAAQKTKVLAIYKGSAAQGKKIFEDKKMTREQKMKAFEKFRDENNKKILAVLTKDQAKKYAEMRQRRPGGPGAPGRGPAAGGGKAGSKTGGGKSGG